MLLCSNQTLNLNALCAGEKKSSSVEYTPKTFGHTFGHFFLSVWQSGPSQGFYARWRVSHLLMFGVLHPSSCLGKRNAVSWVESDEKEMIVGSKQ